MSVIKMIKELAFLLLILFVISLASFSQGDNLIKKQYDVKLPEAHVGSMEIDTLLLNSYGQATASEMQFLKEARTILKNNADVRFSDPDILALAKRYQLSLLGKPILGQLSNESVTLWLRPASKEKIEVNVREVETGITKKMILRKIDPGKAHRMVLGGLSEDCRYSYSVFIKRSIVAKGHFKTAPSSSEKSEVRIAFGSCFHKIGLHNPNLVNQIVARNPHAMMLLGDIAVDDRENNINMHRADYMLRDLSHPWQNLSNNVPIYATWDDHDYLNNDLSGLPDRFSQDDIKALRRVWAENWNNPENARDGIYFNTRIGPVELIMLDTRSCRAVKRRGELDSYLGKEQRLWLENVLKTSSAPFKIISSGTMWSDYVTNGKDSWGTWDVEAREQIFSFIEENKIIGVLLISGDRHGARGFTIPRENGFKFYEFEAASLGGVKGPPAMVKDSSNQLFGYHGLDIRGFGEFTFNTLGEKPVVTFRLINEKGDILEDYPLMYDELIP